MKKKIETLNFGKLNKKLIKDFCERFGIRFEDESITHPIMVSNKKKTGIKLYSTIEWGHPDHFDIQPYEDKTQELLDWINKNFKEL